MDTIGKKEVPHKVCNIELGFVDFGSKTLPNVRLLLTYLRVVLMTSARLAYTLLCRAREDCDVDLGLINFSKAT